MLLQENSSLKEMLFFTHTIQKPCMLYLQLLHNIYLVTDFLKFFFWLIFNNVFAMNTYLPFMCMHVFSFGCLHYKYFAFSYKS